MARPALIAALALGLTGCPTPELQFRHEDLTLHRPLPAPRVLVGKRVLVRFDHESGAGPGFSARIWLDVFPPNARLTGAWIQITSRGEVLEGPVPIRAPNGPGERGYYLEWSCGAGCRRVAVTEPGPERATLWLGPVCVGSDCEVLRADDALLTPER